jgi:hypothetical protein
MPNDNSFQKFYFEKVALGEGCGCAEHIISARELDDRSRGAPPQGREQGDGRGRVGWLSRLFGVRRVPAGQ